LSLWYVQKFLSDPQQPTIGLHCLISYYKTLHLFSLISFPLQLIFDGCRNPAKAPTSHLRAERRKKAEHRARFALSSNNEDEARKAIVQTVEVTPQMAYDLMQRLHAYQVQFIVAPYEADAQLAYLANIPPENGGVAAVLTEDSDLIAYGCTALLFKCDLKGAGIADEMRLDRMLEVDLSTLQIEQEKQQRQPPENEKEEEQQEKKAGKTKDPNSNLDIIDLVEDGTVTNTNSINTMTKKCTTKNCATTTRTGGKNVSFFQWNTEMVLSMCVLAGCDFLQNIAGLGFKTAHALVLQGRTLEGTFAHMRHHTRWKSKLTNEYQQGAKRARESFLYALVFNPMTGKTTRLRELPEELRSLPERGIDLPVHIGPEMDNTLVHGIAHGYINAHTMQPFDTRIPPPMPEKSRWKVQLHPPQLECVVRYSMSPACGGGGGGSGGGFCQQGQHIHQKNTGNWFVAGTSAPSSNTVNVSHFVNSPAASGGSGRGGAGDFSEKANTEFPSTSQSVAPLASQTSPLEHGHVGDLMQMYTSTPVHNTKTTQPGAVPAPAAAPAAAGPTTNKNNAINLNAARPGPSRFAPTSLAGNSKASNNPFATVARAPLQPLARPHHQQQQQTKQRQRPQEVATAPLPVAKQQQRAVACFKGPHDGRPSQQSVSLGSVLDHDITAGTSSQPQKWIQHNPTGKKKDNTPMAMAPLRLPSRNAPLRLVPESQPSVSLAGLFSSSYTTTYTENATHQRDQAQILNNSIFFSGSSQRTESAAVLRAGTHGGNTAKNPNDHEEVTSPLKGKGNGAGDINSNKVEKPMAMVPRMPTVQPRSLQQENQKSQRLQPEQRQHEQQSTATPAVWNVRKPTMSSFEAQRSASGGNSNGSGFQNSKRKSGDGRAGGKKSKKVADMQAAAANCARISSFFTAPKKPS